MTRAQLHENIEKFLDAKYQGRAWFKGGGYSYLFRTDMPFRQQASDGSVFHDTWENVIEKFCDRGIWEDFIDTDPEYWSDFFRASVKGQDDHEFQNLRGY